MIDSKYIKQLICKDKVDHLIISIKDFENYLRSVEEGISEMMEYLFSDNLIRWRFPCRTQIYTGEDITKFDIDVDKLRGSVYISDEFISHFKPNKKITVIKTEGVLY